MDFSSLPFLFLFLPIFLLAYLVIDRKLRLYLVIAASVIYLITGEPTAPLWLGGILVLGYVLGLKISSVDKTIPREKIWLWLGISINLIILAFFKYLSSYGANGLTYLPNAWATPIASLAIPIGLSYITFQMISYLVDIWRERIPVEKNLLRLSLYIFFFPKIVSGPLVRYKAFSEQLNQMAPSMENIAIGLRRFIAGFIKRILIANQLGLVTNAVFNLPTPNFEPRFAWIALVAYALQIYLDFSGFIDMAIGLGLMIGVHLPENFNYPYTAKSISDFWQKWHITLTTWFREYVFYPLERRRLKWAGQQINILIVFLLTGLWHGFKPTFIAWGLLHGLAMALESAGFGRLLKNAWRPLCHIYTLAIVLLGWIFFRSNSLSYAIGFISRLAGNTSGITPLPFSETTPLPFIEPSFILAMVVGIILCFPVSSLWNQIRSSLEKKKPILFFVIQPIEDIMLVALFVLGLAAALSSVFAPNIYAKF